MKTVILAGVAAFAVTAATIAFAQPQSGAQGMHHHMAGPVTRAQMEAKVRTHFAEVDANKDGFVTHEEMQAAMTRHRAERMEQKFARLDADKNGQISKQEFMAGHERGHGHDMGMKGDMAKGEMTKGGMAGMGGMGGMHRMGGREGMGEHMFAMADANHDSRVSLKEATDAALKHFDMADANHDGTLSPQERMQAHQKMREMMRAQQPKGG